MKKRVIDLFAGAGGFSSGFIRSGYDVVAAVEYDKQISETYKENHKKTKMFTEDIKDISESRVLAKFSDIDVIIGGPPCQGFSMAGARIRKNFIDDPRNYLFKHYFSIVQQIKPKIFIMENVKGLLTMDNGEVFNQIHQMFENPDNFKGDRYYLKHHIFKTVKYGIPQKRERVVIIGVLNKDFDIDTLIKDTRNKISSIDISFFDSYNVWDAISNLKDADENGISRNLISTNEYQRFLSNRDNIAYNHIKPCHTQKTLERMSKISQGENFRVLDEIINSVHSGSYGRLHVDEPSPTITTRFDTPSAGKFIHPYELRTLSPREGARIQSFNDDFKFVGNKSSIYKQIGNAVPPKLAYFIAEMIKLI